MDMIFDDPRFKAKLKRLPKGVGFAVHVIKT